MRPQCRIVRYFWVLEDTDMFSPNKCPWGAGASKEMPVPLVFDLCVIVGCGQHQNSTFPTWPQHAILLPTRSSSCLLAIFLSFFFFFFLFLEIILSGEKSGLVCFTLGGSCSPHWVCRPREGCSWMVRPGTGKGRRETF